MSISNFSIRNLFLLVSIILTAAGMGRLSAQPVESDQSPAPTTIPDKANPDNTFRDCDLCPQMAIIPAGRFDMGSDDRRSEERPRHGVVISRPFGMGVLEVTVDQWDACLREGVCRQSPAQGLAGQLPMTNVSWDDAQDYVKWLSGKAGAKYRLPTEAEWEYATRAGSTGRYWWGDDKGSGRANCADCGSDWDGKEASPAGSFEPNPYGLYDVHGNVWEWTQDCWNPSYKDAPEDGEPWMRGDCISRILRGGSWAVDHQYMRSARRSRYDRDVRYYLNGFRVVKELPATAAPIPSNGDLPFEAAILGAAKKVFSKASGPTKGTQPHVIAIDPLIDGLSGAESLATRSMGSFIAELINADYGQFTVTDLAAPSVSKPSHLVVGTFTGVNKKRKTAGVRDAYRICLTVLDLKTGTMTSKAKVFARTEGVDITPTQFYKDSPVWIADASAQAYIDACQVKKPGDAIDSKYLDRLEASALIKQAIDVYEHGQLRESRDLFKRAAKVKGGDQLRTYNGLYLTNWKLGDRTEAEEAFDKLLDYGLNIRQLGIRFPFRPGSADFQVDPNDDGQSDMWLTRIANAALQRGDCLEIVGHAHRLGPEAINQRLSLRRAEYVKERLDAEAPELSARTIAAGKGSAENLIGNGAGNITDELDRRLEIDAFECTKPD